MTAHVDPRFGATLRQLREQAGLSLRALAQLTHRGKSHLHELENGSKAATFETARHLDQALNAGGRLARLVAAPVDHEASDRWSGRPTPRPVGRSRMAPSPCMGSVRWNVADCRRTGPGAQAGTAGA
ncbi:helix-turn-helix domain-containing protein [Micromonospora sp. NPDC005252]|uniref:helix-turn-helix domain-containing protein n=1 Tax=Micromonospora sp. NPDC005252 TaxID=3364228 RepID=UPI00369A84C1